MNGEKKFLLVAFCLGLCSLVILVSWLFLAFWRWKELIALGLIALVAFVVISSTTVMLLGALNEQALRRQRVLYHSELPLDAAGRPLYLLKHDPHIQATSITETWNATTLPNNPAHIQIMVLDVVGEWNTPVLQQTSIQANVNVVALEVSTDSTFDYWLRISTLERGKPIRVPVKLADYHRRVLTGKTMNSSVTLNRRADGWWLTLSYDEKVAVQTEPDAPVIGIDVGIANFLTSSDGKHYGTFHGKLRERQKRDREKRRRKAKLRACLKKKGVENLPSTSSKSGQRLGRHVRQEVNRAVNVCLDEHPGAQIAYEQLSVASMKFKARAMNAYLRASNLARIPEKIAWETAKRGMAATKVKSAYSSQECSVCHYPDRANRPDQQTFCCLVCGFSTHADHNAAKNLARRSGDTELHACPDRQAIKALLTRRHEQWRKQKGWP
jgi:Putative transposase DNA-binding domain